MKDYERFPSGSQKKNLKIMKDYGVEECARMCFIHNMTEVRKKMQSYVIRWVRKCGITITKFELKFNVILKIPINHIMVDWLLDSP